MQLLEKEMKFFFFIDVNDIDIFFQAKQCPIPISMFYSIKVNEKNPNYVFQWYTIYQ